MAYFSGSQARISSQLIAASTQERADRNSNILTLKARITVLYVHLVGFITSLMHVC